MSVLCYLKTKPSWLYDLWDEAWEQTPRAGGAASEGDTSAHSFSALRMGDLQPITPHPGPPAWGAAPGGDSFHSVLSVYRTHPKEQRVSRIAPMPTLPPPPGTASFRLSPQLVVTQLGAHHSLALWKVSEHPFLPPQIVSKNAVRMQRGKERRWSGKLNGLLPEWPVPAACPR